MDLGLDRGTLAAAFAGAVAYLALRDRMPLGRAVVSVVAGTAAAAYLGPGIVEGLNDYYHVALGPKAQAALIFVCGVGGIWLLNFISNAFESGSSAVGGWVNKMFGKAPTPKLPAVDDDTPAQQGGTK